MGRTILSVVCVAAIATSASVGIFVHFRMRKNVGRLAEKEEAEQNVRRNGDGNGVAEAATDIQVGGGVRVGKARTVAAAEATSDAVELANESAVPTKTASTDDDDSKIGEADGKPANRAFCMGAKQVALVGGRRHRPKRRKNRKVTKAIGTSAPDTTNGETVSDNERKDVGVAYNKKRASALYTPVFTGTTSAVGGDRAVVDPSPIQTETPERKALDALLASNTSVNLQAGNTPEK